MVCESSFGVDLLGRTSLREGLLSFPGQTGRKEIGSKKTVENTKLTKTARAHRS
jgi:hypothetical protein